MSSEANPPAAPSTASLQLHPAEFDQSSELRCSFCKTRTAAQYFQVKGETACLSCSQDIDSVIFGDSKLGRTLLAFVAGLGGAVAGFLFSWLIRILIGFELALAAIVIGFMVGAAVRWGAKGRGGLFYQLMAVVLTYISIASHNTPDIMQGMRQAREERTAAEAARRVKDTTAAPAAKRHPAAHWFELFIRVIFAFGYSLTIPFIGGFSKIIGWLIIGFALWQAWRMNKHVPIQISGPFNAVTPRPPVLRA